MADVENAVCLGFRPKAGAYRGVPMNPETHGMKDLPADVSATHDHYHADLMSRAGIILRKVFLRIAKITRLEILENIPELKNTYKTSRAVWHLIDGEFSDFNAYGFPLQDRNTLPIIFCQALTNHSKIGVYFFIDKKQMLTDMGVVCLLDMVKNLKFWQKDIGLNPELMTIQYSDHFNSMKRFAYEFPDIHQQETLYKLILYRLYCLNRKERIVILKQKLDKGYTSLKEQYMFKRNNLISFIGVIDKKTLTPLMHSTDIAKRLDEVLIAQILNSKNPKQGGTRESLSCQRASSWHLKI